MFEEVGDEIMLTNSELDILAGSLADRILMIIESRKPISRWLTIGQAKEYAKIKSDNTIKKWINEGYIHANRTTGEWRIDRESIDDWLKQPK
jgi:excisionase family DNA binding protein